MKTSNLNVFMKTYPKIHLFTEASVRRLFFLLCFCAWCDSNLAVPHRGHHVALRAGEKGTALTCCPGGAAAAVTWGCPTCSGEAPAEEQGKGSGGGLGAASALIFCDLTATFG